MDSITVDDWQKIVQEIGKLNSKQVIDALRNVHEHGFLLWKRERSSEKRLQSYLDDTAPEDVALVLDPEYPDRYKLGLEPAPVTPMWALFLMLPLFIWHDVAQDFRTLLRAAETKYGLDMAPAGGSLLAPSANPPAASTLGGY